MTPSDSITVRRAMPADLPAIVETCGQALQWSDEGTDEAFFRWKHVDNPFGPSPIWVAEDGADGPDVQVVGVRAMMRWALQEPGGPVLPTVRAVDTATLPSHQGRGIFSRLTMGAVEALTEDGVAAVFNTPNDKSRGGYLKMGWHQLGRVAVNVQPRTIGSALAMVRSRVAADKWGIETEVGLDPVVALADPEPISAAIGASPARAGLATPLTVDYLRWRTGFGPLKARIAPLAASIDGGFLVFRLRTRGRLRQLSILHRAGPADRSTTRRAVRRLLRDTEADLVMSSGSTLGLAEGVVPLPKAGPILTWRPLASDRVPEATGLDLELGAVELF